MLNVADAEVISIWPDENSSVCRVIFTSHTPGHLKDHPGASTMSLADITGQYIYTNTSRHSSKHSGCSL